MIHLISLPIYLTYIISKSAATEEDIYENDASSAMEEEVAEEDEYSQGMHLTDDEDDEEIPIPPVSSVAARVGDLVHRERAVPLKSQQERYDKLVEEQLVVEERSDNGSGRFRLPALKYGGDSTLVTTVWPADTNEVVVDKILFMSVIARVVTFKPPANSRDEAHDKLVLWCNCRYYFGVVISKYVALLLSACSFMFSSFHPSSSILFRAVKKTDDRNVVSKGEWSVDPCTLEKLHLCIAKAARESHSISEYNTVCANLLAAPHSSSKRSKSSDSPIISSLECVHVSALRKVLHAESLDGHMYSATENLEKIPLPVGANSFVARMLSKNALNGIESQYITDAASLRPSSVLQPVAEEELVDDGTVSFVDFMMIYGRSKIILRREGALSLTWSRRHGIFLSESDNPATPLVCIR